MSGGAASASAISAKGRPGGPPEAYTWSTFGGDQIQSVNTGERLITAGTVPHLHKLWSVTLPDLADDRPVEASGIKMPDGRNHTVMYLTTDNGTLTAINPVTGKQFWAVTPPLIKGAKATKASPAVDPVREIVYSATPDGKVYRFSAATGKELNNNGWPETVTRMPLTEKLSSALDLIGRYLYVTTSSFGGDAPPYQGHVVTIDTRTGAKRVFNTLCTNVTHVLAPHECTDNGAGIWARPGVVQDPQNGNVLFSVSDVYNTKGGHDWGENVVELSPDGTRVVDSWAPGDYQGGNEEWDVGSVAPIVLPKLPDSKTPYLAVQGEKAGMLMLLNLQNMSGQGALQTVKVGSQIEVQPIGWQDPEGSGVWVFVPSLGGLDAYQVVTSAQGVTAIKRSWAIGGMTSSTPFIAGGVLFDATSDNLMAIDPRSGHVLWSSTSKHAGGNIAYIHWESPLVVGGKVYCTDESNQLTAYGLS
jgi:outer membrane protein assembly factor BamB